MFSDKCSPHFKGEVAPQTLEGCGDGVVILVRRFLKSPYLEVLCAAQIFQYFRSHLPAIQPYLRSNLTGLEDL